MDTIKIAFVSGIIAIGISASMYGFLVPDPVQPTVTNVGAISSPVVDSYMMVNGVFTQGGNILASSTSDTTETILASDLEFNSVLDLNPIVGATTYTLPATTSFPGIPNPGNARTIIIRNATTTSTNITIAAGTGIDLQEPDGQNVVIGTTNYALITCYRQLSTDIACVVDETIPAD